VPLVIGASTLLYIFSLLASGGGMQGDGLNFLAPSREALLRLGASGAIPVFVLGSWWTVLSASWLHGSLLHILFNMMAVRNIGPLSVDLIGPARTIIIYVVSGICGFLLSSVAAVYFPAVPFLRGAPLTVGASASIAGLIGGILHYGNRSGSGLIRGQAVQWALMLVVSAFFFRGVDNYAHLGGFLGGYAASFVLNPLTRERGDHMLVAVVGLVLSFLSIVASLFKGLPA
jgi:rhomboid protease GluP